MTKHTSAVILLICALVASARISYGQSLPRFGVGAKISTLGIGLEAGTAVTRSSNVRGGFNFFNYDRSFSSDGIDYGAGLRLRSVEAHYDWFVGHGFHVSPGLLVYNNNRAEGTATVPGGRSFTLGSDAFTSNPANPVTGTAEFHFSGTKVSPMLTAGFGNLLRRSGRPFTVTFDGGVVFQSEPKAILNLRGSACSRGLCADVASTPQIQADVRAEQDKFNNGTISGSGIIHDLLKFYPVISVGIGYRFK